MSEADDLLAAWKRTYAEMNPGRNADAMRYEDSTLALVMTLRQEFLAFIEKEIAAASKVGSVANLRTRTMDKLAKHNSTDPE